MIPFLLAAAGGYLIAQSRKDDSLYEDGGLMKDFEKNFTTAYILQQQMAEKEKVQGVAHDSYDTTYYNQKYYPIRYHDGQAFASKELYNDLRDSSGNIKGDDEREVEEKVTGYFDEPYVKKLSGSTLHDMWKNGEGIPVEKKKKKSWFFKDGGTIDEQLSAFDISNLDDYEKMRYDSLIKSVPKEKALQILINDVEGDYSQLSPKLRSLAKRCMAKGGKVDRYYIDYLNKKKNFKQDRKYFDSYNSAFSWAMKNFERFDRDMIKIE